MSNLIRKVAMDVLHDQFYEKTGMYLEWMERDSKISAVMSANSDDVIEYVNVFKYNHGGELQYMPRCSMYIAYDGRLTIVSKGLLNMKASDMEEILKVVKLTSNDESLS